MVAISVFGLVSVCPWWEPVPAGKERAFPGPARADGQGPLPGVACEAGGDVPDPVAEQLVVTSVASSLVGGGPCLPGTAVQTERPMLLAGDTCS